MKAVAASQAKEKRELVDSLLHELAEECRRILDLVAKLHGKRNGKIKRAEILPELCTSIVHLHAHTKELPDLIYDEYDQSDN